MDLAGARAILTGASRGIGARLAERLAVEGVDMVLAARSLEDIEQLSQRLTGYGVRTVPVQADVTKAEDLESLVAAGEASLGGIDLLINNAGIEHYERYELIDPEIIRAIVETNLVAPQVLTRLVLPQMVKRRRGHILNIASLAGRTVMPYNTVYSASKHGLVGFSWSLRAELESYGIGVSVVCPGFVKEVGMHAVRGRTAPSLTGEVTPSQVVDEAVSAIVHNRPEVVVAPPLARVGDVVFAASPRFALWMTKRSGLVDFLREEAASPSH